MCPAGIALIGALCSVLQSPAGPERPADSPWRVAVVFEVKGGRRTYRGVVPNPGALPATAPVRPDQSDGLPGAAERHYEIWYSRDGETVGFRHYPGRGEIAAVSADGVVKGIGPDDGTAARLFGRMRRTTGPAPPPPRNPEASIACPGSRPDRIEWLCRGSDFIAVGRVIGIWRNAYSPINGAGPEQHTVALFAVEEFLLERYSLSPPVLKVYQVGGYLGRGFALHGCPLLNVGDRYIVFVYSPAKHFVKHKLPYIEGTFPPYTGKLADWDEVSAHYGERSSVLLTLAGTMPMDPSVSWMPWKGEALIGVPERTAINRIRAVVEKLRPLPREQND